MPEISNVGKWIFFADNEIALVVRWADNSREEIVNFFWNEL